MRERSSNSLYLVRYVVVVLDHVCFIMFGPIVVKKNTFNIEEVICIQG